MRFTLSNNVYIIVGLNITVYYLHAWHRCLLYIGIVDGCRNAIRFYRGFLCFWIKSQQIIIVCFIALLLLYIRYISVYRINFGQTQNNCLGSSKRGMTEIEKVRKRMPLINPTSVKIKYKMIISYNIFT